MLVCTSCSRNSLICSACWTLQNANCHRYEGESIKKQPNLFLSEIDLFFFNVIALYNDALGPTVFQCHQPRTEEARVLVSDPLLNCRHDFFVGPEMTSTDILFSSLGIGNNRQELSPENRWVAVLARTHSAQQDPLQFCKCGLSHCPVGAESLWRVYLGVLHGSQFSVGRASLHNTHLLLYFSLLESPTL